METRKITIVSTKTQKKSVIMSSAETLGQLKADLRAANIDYTDMTFYEGTSKTELKTDESVLPKDVPYTNRTTGETKNTNELVFMLTNTDKKIKSGAVMSRAEVYNVIKAHNLQTACVAKYGKNYTQCSTDALNTLIQENVKESSTTEVIDFKARAAIDALVRALYAECAIEQDARNEVLDILGSTKAAPLNSSYNDEEIDAMFRHMC